MTHVTHNRPVAPVGSIATSAHLTNDQPSGEQQRSDRNDSRRNNLDHPRASIKCSRCPERAFVRLDDEYVLCASCWNKCCSELTRRLRDDLEDSVPARDVTAAVAILAPEYGAAAVTTEYPEAGPCGFGPLQELNPVSVSE